MARKEGTLWGAFYTEGTLWGVFYMDGVISVRVVG